MSKELGQLPKAPPEMMRDWSEQFELKDDEMLVLRLNTGGSDRATILLQHNGKKLLAHEESQYDPNEKRGYDDERDIMPFLTWGTWWFVDISRGIYQQRDFEDVDEGSIQGLVYALDAMRGASLEDQRWYGEYAKTLLKGESVYGDVFERAIPLDTVALKAIGLEDLEAPCMKVS